MHLTSSVAPFHSLDLPWIAVGVFEGQSPSPGTPAADLIGRLIESREITGAVGEVVPLYGAKSDASSVLAFGLGSQKEHRAGSAFAAGVAVAKRLAARPRGAVAVVAPEDLSLISPLVQGLIVGQSGPGIRKAEAGRTELESLVIVAPETGAIDPQSLENAVRHGDIIGRAINLARELVNCPPSEKAPAVLAERARAVATAAGLAVEVWDRDRLRAERFGGVLAVASGSAQPPAFVTIEYRGAGDGQALALIGKGVTFDSGGLSLKPSASMEDMKCDMSGAAIVLAVMQAAAALKLPVNVDAYFALTENMTGGNAMKLGDVLTMRNGVTVEVLNTDAEGRLILADVLSYAVERKPSRMIDLATLTGACMVALGNKIAALFSNNAGFATEVKAASKATGERVWELPLDPDFDDAIKSKVADIRNVGGKWGGSITAAKFLQRFVAETPWVHLDIAGPAWSDEDSATRDAGGTGCFVRTLVQMLETANPS